MWKKNCKFHCFFQQLEVWTKKLTEYKSKKSLVGFSSETNAFIISVWRNYYFICFKTQVGFPTKQTQKAKNSWPILGPTINLDDKTAENITTLIFLLSPYPQRSEKNAQQNGRQTREKPGFQYLVVDNIHLASWSQTGFATKPDHQAHPH